MIKITDPLVIAHAKKMNDFYKKNPHRTWRYGLSPERIKELEKVMKV